MNEAKTESLKETIIIIPFALMMGGVWLYFIDGWSLVRYVYVGTPIGLVFLLTMPPAFYIEHSFKSRSDQPDSLIVFVFSSFSWGILCFAVVYPFLFIATTVSRRTDPTASLASRRLADEYPTYMESFDFIIFYLTETSFGLLLIAFPLLLALVMTWQTARETG